MTDPMDIDALLDDPKPKVRPQPPPETAIVERDPPWSWHHIVLLAAITLLAGMLRLYKLDQWSFWIDEVHTLRDAVLKSPDQFWGSPTSRYPVGYLLLRWIQPLLPGSAEGSYRLLFAFFGIASVPLLAVFVRRLLGTGPGLVAGLFLALSPWHLYWSQNCRVYTVLLFLALAGFMAFWIGTEKGSGLWFVIADLMLVLAAASHPCAVLILPAFFVYLALLRTRIVEWPSRLGKRALMWFLIPIALASGLAITTVTKAWLSYEGAKSGWSLPHLMNTTVYFVRLPILGASLIGVILLWQRSRRTCLFLAGMLVLPTIGVGIASLWVRATAQYLFFTLPIWCALAGFGMWALAERAAFGMQRSKLVLQGLLISLVVFDLAAQDHLYFHYRYGDRPRWRDAANYIEHSGSPQDIVASTNTPCLEWYLNPAMPMGMIPDSLDSNRIAVKLLAKWTLDDVKGWQRQAGENRSRVWIVVTEPELYEMNPRRDWDVWLRENFRQVRRFANWAGPKDMTVLVYLYEPTD
ncbi:MAG: hypothetical protein CMJ85_04410 [Planctomycetes bacterium]|nr:hypothetical protein [Planctomycetota bacterium]